MLRFAIPLIAIAVASAPMAASARDFRNQDHDQRDQQMGQVQFLEFHGREGAVESQELQNWESRNQSQGDWQFRTVGYDRPGTVESRREEWRQRWQRDDGSYDRPGTVESRREWRRNWDRDDDDRRDWRRNWDRNDNDGRREWRRDWGRDRDRDRWDYRRNQNFNQGLPPLPPPPRSNYRRDRDIDQRVIVFPGFLF